jgi:TnpA family transposase
MPERQRRAGPNLPEDPSEEELARDWTLSEADLAEVLRRRGDDNRRRFAVQLCVLRHSGRFLDRYQDVPARILNHLNRQLGLMPTVSLPEAERDATESNHQQRLREYFGYRTFDDEARILLAEHLRSRVAQGAWPEDLFDSAMDALRFWRIIPPAVATVDRIAASIAAVGREEMFGRIASRLEQPAREALERVLEVQPGQSRSLLFRFRDYPPEATPASLADYLYRYQEIISLGVAGFDLSGVPPAVIDHLAQLTRRLRCRL